MSLRGAFAGQAFARTIGIIGLVACGSAGGDPPPGDPPGTTPGAGGGNETETPPAPSAPGTVDPAGPKTPGPTAKECFKDLVGAVPGPDYDKFKPTIAKSCAGTHQQTIAGVQKVVFLGDSVTVGTPPTKPEDFYRARLEKALEKKFGAIETASCAKWGARTDDLLEGGKQIEQCFPGGVEKKKTLVVMTNGGNDVHAWAKDKLPVAAAKAKADEAVKKLRTAIDWLKSPTHFPSGSFVVFANVYEYTDTSGDLESCPTAQFAGMSGSWPEATPAIVHFEEQFMKVAVDTKTDLMFMFEHFCGHGYKREDASLQCYRGPDAALWFDATCIHPTPGGHEQIAGQFEKVIVGN